MADNKRIRTYAVTWRNGAEEIVVANYVAYPSLSPREDHRGRSGFNHIRFYYGAPGNMILGAAEDAFYAIRLISDVAEEDLQPKEEATNGEVPVLRQGV